MSSWELTLQYFWVWVGQAAVQSMGSWRVGHNWATSLSLFTFTHWRRKWQPTLSVLAWRIPGTGKPGGLPSMGSHRVGHDWSDLAAAAAAGQLCLLNSKMNDCLSTFLFPMNSVGEYNVWTAFYIMTSWGWTKGFHWIVFSLWRLNIFLL